MQKEGGGVEWQALHDYVVAQKLCMRCQPPSQLVDSWGGQKRRVREFLCVPGGGGGGDTWGGEGEGVHSKLDMMDVAQQL